MNKRLNQAKPIERAFPSKLVPKDQLITPNTYMQSIDKTNDQSHIINQSNDNMYQSFPSNEY